MPVTAEQPYKPALGDWVATSLDGLPVRAFRVVGTLEPSSECTPGARLLAIPEGVRCTFNKREQLALGGRGSGEWLKGWNGRSRLIVLTRRAGIRPATPSEIQAAQLSQLSGGGL